MYVEALEIYTTIINVFYGRNRKNSDEDNCIVALCYKHHNGSNQGVHFDPVLDKIIKERMEYAWLKFYNKEVKDFIARYKINYLS